MTTPVYICTGFLDSGKTTFIKDTLMKQEWIEEGPTLLLQCEEGEEEYSEKYLDENGLFLFNIEEREKLNKTFFENCEKIYHPVQVIIEYNGTWDLQEILDEDFPRNWEIQGVYSTVSGETLDMYLKNMRNMLMNQLTESELIINPDGSIFHLHIKPEQLANKIILVGDPGRVALVASHFDTKECEIENREFKTITGTYKGKRLTVVSTGIGCDNIDIVMNELDALANIDFNTRYEKDHLRQLELVRIGTCGGLQPYTPVGTYVCSEKSIGFDGLLNFYAGRNEVCDLKLEQAFIDYMGWEGNVCIAHPYVIDADRELIDRIAQNDMVRGVTIAAGGFFGPQGRELRIPLADPKQNEKIEKFEYNDYRITNFEMESSALAGLARLMGHKAMTVCMVIANRLIKEANTGYKNSIDGLIEKVLERI